MKFKVLSGFVKPKNGEKVGELAKVDSTIELPEKDPLTVSLLQRRKIKEIKAKTKATGK